jgi:hypothetical protein
MSLGLKTTRQLLVSDAVDAMRCDAILMRLQLLQGMFKSMFVHVKLTAASHLRNSSRVQSSGLPWGSDSGGNMSPPQMDHIAAAATTPPKAYIDQQLRSQVVNG